MSGKVKLAPHLLLFLFLPALGCSSLVKKDGDYFEAAGKDPGRFMDDDQICARKANDYLSYGLRGMSGTNYARNRSYNEAYSNCMMSRGYKPRPYWKNFVPSD